MTNNIDEIHQQTSRVHWKELERHFARGVVLLVADEMDLVNVAATFLEDDSRQVKAWLDAGLVAPLADDQAARFAGQDVMLWAVVTAPWVLVQERKAASDAN